MQHLQNKKYTIKVFQKENKSLYKFHFIDNFL